MTGTYFDIQRFCVHDGPGIRTTVFMKGCPLRCAWCHNPEGLAKSAQVQFFAESCIGCNLCKGERTVQAVSLCPTGALKCCGAEITEEALLEQVLSDRDFYGAKGGVTFSGGECLLQSDFVAGMLHRIKEQGITTAVDTCGAVEWSAIEKTLPYCDTYLYDVKCADAALHKAYTGLDNTRILENLRKLDESGAVIWIRVPVIPDVNDTESETRAIAEIVNGLQNVRRVTLIPYHTLGKSKYQTLGLTPAYETNKTVNESRLAQYRTLFSSQNRTVE